MSLAHKHFIITQIQNWVGTIQEIQVGYNKKHVPLNIRHILLAALCVRTHALFVPAEVETWMTQPSSSSKIPPAAPIPISTPPPAISYPGSPRPVAPSRPRSHFSFAHYLKPHGSAPPPQTSPAWKWSDFLSISMSSSSRHGPSMICSPSTTPPPPEPTASEPSYLLEQDQEDLEADIEGSLDGLSRPTDPQTGIRHYTQSTHRSSTLDTLPYPHPQQHHPHHRHRHRHQQQAHLFPKDDQPNLFS
ncbi:hypothetical protein P691DRAFT_781300 [Macrolepiota fuliginosa MF-IS2]|uniref:Uncharacterized protein n=1 Tax=Macrolepiota fuliginosa MF-IS2 TaxID=1400762 RepID=A0A9P5WZX8_9AGAR|nr:hypothetical protein P691DRAFT_781300 [Macrolepiota fuliginosa MF-IS2]